MKPIVRAARIAAAMSVCATLVVAGCATTIPGMPTTAAQDPDSAIVALMDTGDYATAAGKPFGTAGDIEAGALLEAHRIADFTVGPWEVDGELTTLPGAIGLSQVGPISSSTELGRNHVLDGELPDIANTHGFVSGFSTVRLAPPKSGQQRGLHSAVLRFPDPAAAEAAAAEMATKLPIPPGATPAGPVTLGNAPEARAVAFTYPDTKTEQIVSFTTHGPYVLYVVAQTGEAFIGKSAETLAGGITDQQKRRIDEFTPTALPVLKDLPLDPTGQLLARTLAAPSNEAPFNIGIWNARGWLHFEDDPIAANTLFNTAGVDVVAQRRATVYQAANPDGAARVADGLNRQIGSFSNVHGIEGVPGLPAATCYQRFQGALPDTAPMTWQRVVWGFKCVAVVDRYAYTAFSTTAEDVRQQMAAQYRILAGQ